LSGREARLFLERAARPANDQTRAMRWQTVVIKKVLSLNFPSRRQQGTGHMSKIIAFLNDESGATAIEYGLIAATVNAIGTTLNGKFDSIATQLK
jgi:Flp pilus assembly pilin Flp